MSEKTYKIIKQIGKGSYGIVYLCQNQKNKELCVVKSIDLSSLNEKEKEETINESKILQKLDHQNIIKFIDFFINKEKKTLNIVTEYADGGDLSEKINKQPKKNLFPENEILDYFTQICLALKHIHDKKIIHRDLKSQNIFLTKKGLVKIGDFGVAKNLQNTWKKASTMIGTPYYLSPEIVLNKPYSFESDIWSLGVLLYEMMALKMPFDAISLPMLTLKIMKGEYPPPPKIYSEDLRKLVSSLLNVNPQKRPNINQVLKFSIIRNRIISVLNENQFNKEFSVSIVKNYKMEKKNKIQGNNIHENHNVRNVKSNNNNSDNIKKDDGKKKDNNNNSDNIKKDDIKKKNKIDLSKRDLSKFFNKEEKKDKSKRDNNILKEGEKKENNNVNINNNNIKHNEIKTENNINIKKEEKPHMKLQIKYEAKSEEKHNKEKEKNIQTGKNQQIQYIHKSYNKEPPKKIYPIEKEKPISVKLNMNNNINKELKEAFTEQNTKRPSTKQYINKISILNNNNNQNNNNNKKINNTNYNNKMINNKQNISYNNNKNNNYESKLSERKISESNDKIKQRKSLNIKKTSSQKESSKEKEKKKSNPEEDLKKLRELMEKGKKELERLSTSTHNNNINNYIDNNKENENLTQSKKEHDFINQSHKQFFPNVIFVEKKLELNDEKSNNKNVKIKRMSINPIDNYLNSFMNNEEKENLKKKRR
jgi:NIMA (never in mitosis gene a)-related kinase